jgi:Membrane protein involved in the export of O-antigen and teichoic acid
MKNNNPSIKKNYIYNTLYQIFTLITPLITAPYISRVLGAEGVGIQSYTNSIATYFTLAAALGTAQYGQREIAMHRDDPHECSKTFWEIEVLSIISTIIVTFIWCIWIVITSQYKPYYITLTILVLAVAFDISWYFAGKEQFQYIVLKNAAFKLIGIILLFVFIKKCDDLLLYIFILSTSQFLGNLSMWTYLKGSCEKVPLKQLNIKRHVKQTFAYFIPTIATSVYTVLDKTMIGVITNDVKENGYYEQATKIVKMAETLIFSLNTVMSSRMSYLYSQDKYDEIKEKIYKSFDFLMMLSIPLTFGIIGVANNFVPWFFGRDYGPVVYLLYTMAPIIVVITISNILGSQYLTPSGQRVRSSKAIIIGAVTNFMLNSLLIPQWGAVGATIASVISELVISCIYMYMSVNVIHWSNVLATMWKRLIAGGIMLAGLFAIENSHTGSIAITLLQIVAGIGIYSICLALLKDELFLMIFKQSANKAKKKICHGS